MNLKECVDWILKKEKRPISKDQLLEKITLLKKIEDETFELTEEDRAKVQEVLIEGIEDWTYFKASSGYILLCKTPYRKGKITIDGRIGILTSINSYIDKEGNQVVVEEKIEVPKENINSAIDGDIVLADTSLGAGKAKVVEVLDRNLGNVLGEITRLGNQYFVKPLSKKQESLTIALDGEQIEGQRVIVSLKKTAGENFYLGEIIEKLEHKDDPKEEALIEALQCGMPYGFNEEILEQVKRIPLTVTEKDKEGRLDFTDWEIISIDGSDTKDKDDCISLHTLPNGNQLLGVEIADVSHYVPNFSPIHKEAYRRGTSYYFDGSVNPQLPRELSNGICSLSDGVERLTMSVLMELDSNANVVSHSLVLNVIKSRIGMTYEKVNSLLKDKIVDPEYKAYQETLERMASLAKKLRKKRIQRGALELEKPEVKFLYDENGYPVDVKACYQDVAEKLIEEFMLLANSNFAEILEAEGIPVIYRVHGTPNREKLKELLKLLDKIGIPFDFSVEDICEDKTYLQLLIAHIKEKGDSLKDVLITRLIRSMSPAIYSTENIGHYGTGFSIYCHFTSPIRRLADDTNERIAKDCYFEKDEEKRKRAIYGWKKLAPDYADQATKMEMVQEKVEKNVKKLNAVNYFDRLIGEEFEGVVISVNEYGLEVQLNNLLEGVVLLDQEEYIYQPKNFSMISISNLSYYVGDRLKVKLVSTDKEKKQIHFSVLEKIQENEALINANKAMKRKLESKRMIKKRDFF